MTDLENYMHMSYSELLDEYRRLTSQLSKIDSLVQTAEASWNDAYSTVNKLQQVLIFLSFV